MSTNTKPADATGAKNDPITLGEDETTTKELVSTDTTQTDDKLPLPRAQDTCPYLHTIDRRALDFDFEKLCSVSMSKVNVYACLVCGKYFQGRGRSTHAFTHSVSESHHVYLNLETLKFYCLPDNYEINDPSLDDILYVLRPTFTHEDLHELTKLAQPVKAFDGKLYYPGIVGLNNLKYNDYCNVIFQALSHVIPVRNYFLIQSKPTSSNQPIDERNILSIRFGELLRKLWNPRNFKTHVSPHEMLQAIILASKKRFEFTKQSDAIVFLGWFLNSLMGPKRGKDSIIKRTFQGKIRIASRLLLPNVAAAADGEEPELIPAPEEQFDTTSFLYLTLDLPPMPLFPKKDAKGKIINPRVSIHDLLSKFTGTTVHEFRTYRESANKRYEILKLPRYLILYYKRFAHNDFFTDRNTHIVEFPIRNLNLSHLIRDQEAHNAGEAGQAREAGDDVKLLKEYNYTLVANIVHDGEPEAGKGTYRAHILHRGTGKWFEMQDLYVTEMADTMLITLSETYIQVWELQGRNLHQPDPTTAELMR